MRSKIIAALAAASLMGATTSAAIASPFADTPVRASSEMNESNDIIGDGSPYTLGLILLGLGLIALLASQLVDDDDDRVTTPVTP